MGDSIVIKFTSSLTISSVTPPRLPRQRQSPHQQQQSAGQWQPATLILCHSILEANATSEFFVAETFVLDGWSVVVSAFTHFIYIFSDFSIIVRFITFSSRIIHALGLR